MLDPQLDHLITLYKSLKLPQFSSDLSVHAVRKMMGQFSKHSLFNSEQSEVKMTDLFASTEFGLIKLRAYYPQKQVSAAPLVYFRANGFIMDNLKDCDEFCCKLAEKTCKFILSVDFPLAPEFSAEEILEASLQAYLWILEHSEFTNVNAEDITVIGDSSGGLIASRLSQMLVEQKLSLFGSLVLICPILDAPRGHGSYLQYGKEYLMTRDKLIWYHDQLNSKACSELEYLYPLKAPHFKSLPKTHIISAELDPLSDEAGEYAKKLQEAGIECTWINYSGMIHGFLKFKAIKAVDEIFDSLCQKLLSFSEKKQTI